ncbi:MAG TPA: Holliday junction branch migration protein RuvA [Gammaproteobacteria bacterium]|nr:Holliday junction branch migration protein RuvA [Gammaproteobacteria bacterium]|tara:strand:- start:348 stop:941 length:594 start_codon:yes stop_codon:yes gene_type:complete
MISRIQGILIEKRPPWLVVDCNGVGYELEAPMTTVWTLPELNKTVTILTHLIVRDDAHLLFGFATEAERNLFRSLIKVSGIGSKVALAILSGIESKEFVQCVHESNAARLTALPGIGKKTAERLIVEMRDRVGDWAPANLNAMAAPSAPAGNAVNDAISGLIALGYKPPEASRLVLELDGNDKSSEEIIREVLRRLA